MALTQSGDRSENTVLTEWKKKERETDKKKGTC
jgi:hypothetical protein